jgi:hypothetical protein
MAARFLDRLREVLEAPESLREDPEQPVVVS